MTVNQKNSDGIGNDLVGNPSLLPSAPSVLSAQQPTEEFTYSCAYCSISKVGSITSFSTSDLLERHVIKKHQGWTAYPGSVDIQKFEREFREKTIRSIESKVAEIAEANESGNGIMFGSKEGVNLG
jgi:hypothetical protein